MTNRRIIAVIISLFFAIALFVQVGKSARSPSRPATPPVTTAASPASKPLRQINLAQTLTSLELQAGFYTNATTTLQREEAAKKLAAIAVTLFEGTEASFGMPVQDVRASGNNTVTLRFGGADSNAIPAKPQGILLIQPGQPIEITIAMARDAASKIQSGHMAIVTCRPLFRPRQGGTLMGTAAVSVMSKSLLCTLSLRSSHATMPKVIGDLYLEDIRGQL